MENNVDLSEVLRLHELWAEGNPDGEQADLWRANLQEAILRGANLQQANLWGADLWRANLQQANLQGANLQEAILRGADLRGAILRETGCVFLLVERYNCWIAPDSCCIGCEKHTHDFWRTVSIEDIERMDMGAGALWQHWRDGILAICDACARHGWPTPASRGEEQDNASES